MSTRNTNISGATKHKNKQRIGPILQFTLGPQISEDGPVGHVVTGGEACGVEIWEGGRLRDATVTSILCIFFLIDTDGT
jgi:hypothetical protein